MKKFDHPFVVGVIGKNQHGKLFSAEFKKQELPFVYLSLQMRPKFLKNIITCMKLMDVVGINVSPEYEKKIIKFLDRLDTSAKLAKRVNLVAKHGKSFTGYFVHDLVSDSIKVWKLTL